MNTLRKLIALLLLAMFSTTVFAVTNAQVFAYAEANYSSLFAGTAAEGQYLQYNYRYYPDSGNYLAVDTSGEIFVLGEFTGNVIASVGMVTAYADAITAWETTQTGATGNVTPASNNTPSPILTPRSSHTATLLSDGNKVLVVGGGGFLTSTELYDRISGTFEPSGDLITGRWDHQAILLQNGKVAVIGGMAQGIHMLSATTSIEQYDPSTGVWSSAGSLSVARHYFTASLLQNGKVLIAGGMDMDTGVQLTSVEIYDPDTKVSSVVPGLSIARSSHTANVLNDGMVLFAGGMLDDTFTGLATAELYDPSTGTVTAVGNLATARSSHTATLLPDSGKVLVTGGSSDLFSVVTTAEIYDPASKSWSSARASSIARYDYTAVSIGNGKVFLSGGMIASVGAAMYEFSATNEVYDSASNIWSTTTPLATARYEHTATTLPDNKVLIIGGCYITGSQSQLSNVCPSNVEIF